MTIFWLLCSTPLMRRTWLPVPLLVSAAWPSDGYSTAESLGRAISSRDLLLLHSSHKRAVSWHSPWLEVAVESLNEMGGRGNTAPLRWHLKRKTLVRLEQRLVDVLGCPTNLTAADAADEFATATNAAASHRRACRGACTRCQSFWNLGTFWWTLQDP